MPLDEVLETVGNYRQSPAGQNTSLTLVCSRGAGPKTNAIKLRELSGILPQIKFLARFPVRIIKQSPAVSHFRESRKLCGNTSTELTTYSEVT